MTKKQSLSKRKDDVIKIKGNNRGQEENPDDDSQRKEVKRRDS